MFVLSFSAWLAKATTGIDSTRNRIPCTANNINNLVIILTSFLCVKDFPPVYIFYYLHLYNILFELQALRLVISIKNNEIIQKNNIMKGWILDDHAIETTEDGKNYL